MTKSQKHSTYRFTLEAERLLIELAKNLGVSKTAIIEMAIREFAERRKLNGSNDDHTVPIE
jgi:hypothetical protein